MPELFTSEAISAAMEPPPAPAAEVSPTSSSTVPVVEASSTEPAVARVQPNTEESISTTETEPTETIPTTVPPEDRWPVILKNAREKAAQEVKKTYAWADRIPEPHRATVSEFYDTLNTAPVQAIESLILTAANDPVQAPQLRSLLGKLLRSGGVVEAPPEPQASAQQIGLPEPDFQDEQGHTFYSAGKMLELAGAIEARLDSKYARELRPLQSDLQARAEQRERNEVRQQAAEWAEHRYATVSQWPHFADHEQAINAVMAADPALEIGDAYIQVVVPQMQILAKKSVVTQQQQKAIAGSVNPASAASAVSGRPLTFAEGFRQLIPA